MKIRDEVIEYRGHLPGQKGRCRIRVYTGGRATRIMLVTELKDNPGPSVTNAVEFIAQQVTAGDADGCRFVEHYPQRGHCPKGGRQETFDAVEFEGPGFKSPRWKHLGRAGFEALIGEKWRAESWVENEYQGDDR